MAGENNESLAATIYSFGLRVAADSGYAASHPGEAAAAMAAWVLLNTALPDLASDGPQAAARKIAAMAQKYLSGSKIQDIPPAAPSPIPMPYPNVSDSLGGAPLTNNLPAVQGNMQELQKNMQKESLMTSVLTNIANMKHEALKGIAQNLRG
jgi:hypothetical protein